MLDAENDLIMVLVPLASVLEHPHEYDNSDSDKEANLDHSPLLSGTSSHQIDIVSNTPAINNSTGWIDVRKKKWTLAD